MARSSGSPTRALAAQYVNLKRKFPQATTKLRRNKLIWLGDVKPTPYSRTYLIRIDYKWKGVPRVSLVKPALQTREGERCQHLYKDDTLCLYLPNTGEWDDGMFLSDSIIPWASEWLLHYELWLATGKWHGGGTHPVKKTSYRKPRPSERRGFPRSSKRPLP